MRAARVRHLCLALAVCCLGACGNNEGSVQTSTQPRARHGFEQVRNMVRDRPAMGAFTSTDGLRCEMTSESPVWKWVARRYDERILDARIRWDPSEIDKPPRYVCDHVMPSDGEDARIRIRERFLDDAGKIRDLTFEELWCGVVYELLNIRNDEQFLRIYRGALKGKYTRERWVLANTRLEHAALRKLCAFFDNVWKPWAEADNYAYDRTIWYRGFLDDYDAWIAQYHTSDKNPYQYWEHYFDQSIAPYLKSRNIQVR